ncbi:MAG: M20 metallopeptidase family protein [bacterium]
MGNEILQKAQELKDYVTKIRRQIHQNPELGMQEFETTALVRGELEKMGVEIAPLDMKVGLLGVLEGEKPGSGPVIGIRADMDALPIEERTGLPYASQKGGVMHACGHDGHTAILLGTAKLLSTIKDKFSGTVKFIFQPGEETLKGAKSVVDAGVFGHEPKIDILIAAHSWPFVEVGKIGVWSGPYMASSDAFAAKIIGSGGHGAYPHRAKDPLLAACNAVGALQGIISRQIDAAERVVLSVCTIHGGKAFNVIPEEVTFSGTVRTHNKEVRDSMEKRMEKVIKGAAEAYDCKYEFDYDYGIPQVINDPEVVEKIIEAANMAVGEGHAEQLPGPVMGSEDFAVLLEYVPRGAFFRLGILKPGEEPISPHNDRYNFNDDAIPYGMAIFTQFVLNSSK